MHYDCAITYLLSLWALQSGQLRGPFVRAGGGCVAGRAGFCGALATWVWGQQFQPPGSWAPNLLMQLKR